MDKYMDNHKDIKRIFCAKHVDKKTNFAIP